MTYLVAEDHFIHSVVIYFWVPAKQKNNDEKIQKIYIYINKYLKEIQKIIGAKKGCWNAEK
jgi:hypothetical protein